MNKSRNLWITIGSLMLINILVFIIKPGDEFTLTILSDLFPIICSLIAAIYLAMAVTGFKVFDLTKAAWLLIFFSILIFVVAESTYGYLEVVLGYNMDEEFPTVADTIWVLGYIPMFVGLFLLFIGYKRSGLPMGNPVVLVSISAAVLVVATMVVYFIMVPIINDPETGHSEKVFYLSYPIADILIVIPAILLVYITSLFGSGTIAKPLKYLALGFILFTLADMLYSYLDWQGLYGEGNWIDLGWNLGYLLFGAAGLYQYKMVKSLN
jgi:hypothetical protein